MSEESDPKYLAVKNWEKYQPAYTCGQRARWIRSWVDKCDDLEYSRLGCYTRYILDAIRDLRGKTGRNPPNDPSYIARQLWLRGDDAKNVGRAVKRLIEVGFLIESSSIRSVVEHQSKVSRAPVEGESSTSRAPVERGEVVYNQQNSKTTSGKRRGEERRGEDINTFPPSRQKTPRIQVAEYTEKFSEFWKIYPPTNGSKAEAFKAWRKQPCCENGSYDLIITRVKEYARCPQWLDGFIPHAATWINQKRWETQPVMKARSNGSLTPLPGLKAPEKILPFGPGQKRGGCDMGGMRWDNPGEYYKWQNENKGKFTV